MNLFDIILLAIALAMDCFAVSIISGVITSSQSSVAQGFGTYKEITPLIIETAKQSIAKAMANKIISNKFI